jgi:hypothetical protein
MNVHAELLFVGNIFGKSDVAISANWGIFTNLKFDVSNGMPYIIRSLLIGIKM